MKNSPSHFLAAIVAVAVVSLANTHGALTLTIDEFNSSTLTFTVAGTVDAPTEGSLFPGIFTVASDELVSTAFYTGAPVVSSTTIEIDGIPVYVQMWDNGGVTGFSAYFYDSPSASYPSGATLSGSVTFTGDFTSQPSLNLWSGYDDNRNLNRLEAIGNVIPEPSCVLLSAMGILMLARRRR